MGSVRVFRLLEGSLVVLFFVQATRTAFAMLLGMVNVTLSTGQVSPAVVNSHLLLIVILVPAWFSPRIRSALPETLRVSAVLVAVARVVMALPFGLLLARLYAALALVALGGVYFASLLRANRRSWLSAMAAGFALDQLFRARDTFDLSLQSGFEMPIADLRYRIPWYVAQIVLSLILILAGMLARRLTRQESYEPAFLTPLGGLAVGAFFALETIVLAMPNVVARWAGVPYAGLVPWLLLATTLPLVPSVRNLMGQTFGMFAERSRGWVWLFILLLVIVVGNRLGGFGAAGALVVAQFIAVLLLWWIPRSPDPTELEQVGPSISLGLLACALLVYAYSLTFVHVPALEWLGGQGVIVVLVAAALLGLPGLAWHESDPWLERPATPAGGTVAFVAPVVVLGLILSGLGAGQVDLTPRDALRVATYNVNGGYDADGVFQLESIADVIEISLADVVVLQEVDAGTPPGYGIDQVQFLARHLGMYQLFQPTGEHVRGVAVLSRWPISQPAGALLPGDGDRFGIVRGLVQDAASSRSVTVVGAQLAPGSEEERLQQVAVLLNLTGEDTPLVLAADLGASPQDVVYRQLLETGFLDPDTALGIERGFTFPAADPTERRDYILLRDLFPRDALQANSTASDHRLVVVEVEWP